MTDTSTTPQANTSSSWVHQHATLAGHTVEVTYPSDTPIVFEVCEHDSTWTAVPELADQFANMVAAGWDTAGTAGAANGSPFLRVNWDRVVVTVNGDIVPTTAAVSAGAGAVVDAVVQAAVRIEAEQGVLDDTEEPATAEALHERCKAMFDWWDSYTNSSDPVSQASALVQFSNALFHFRWQLEEAEEARGVGQVM